MSTAYVARSGGAAGGGRPAAAGGPGEPHPPGSERRLGLRARLLRFLAVGASGVVVNLGALALLAGGLGVRDAVASAAAIELSILWNFALHSAFTYRDLGPGARAGRVQRLLRFSAVSAVGLGIQLGTFLALQWALLHALNQDGLGALRYPVQCAGIALATAWSFAGNLRFTWGQRAGQEGVA